MDARACSLCRRDHKKCTGERPCPRCAQNKWECRDVKKRGRPARKDIEAKAKSIGNQQQPTSTHHNTTIKQTQRPQPQQIQPASQQTYYPPIQPRIATAASPPTRSTPSPPWAYDSAQSSPEMVAQPVLGSESTTLDAGAILSSILLEIKELRDTAEELKSAQQHLSSQMASLNNKHKHSINQTTDDTYSNHNTHNELVMYNSHYNNDVNMLAMEIDECNTYTHASQAMPISRPIVDFDSLPYVPFVLRDPTKPYVMLKAMILPATPSFQGLVFERVLAVNSGLSQLLEYENDELSSMPCHESIIPRTDPNNVRERNDVLQRLRSDEPVSPVIPGVQTMVSRSGTPYELTVDKQFFYNEKGELSFFIICFNGFRRRPPISLFDELSIPEEEQIVEEPALARLAGVELCCSSGIFVSRPNNYSFPDNNNNSPPLQEFTTLPLPIEKESAEDDFEDRFLREQLLNLPDDFRFNDKKVQQQQVPMSMSYF